jgi:acylphosphatase
VDAVRRHLWISGRVQGVAFRAYARQAAMQLGVAGWVRNLGDGRVEVVAEGEPAAVDDFERWARRGPPAARVARVDTVAEPLEGLDRFEVR